ncbi:MAG: bifunctional diaminohydroxyphosphoribosylaminopyrimidine deaminase/5-amino-6-(5-phosphoribosylamino)uracil reductase RibD [Chitinophagales bacterium]
MPNPPVGCVIVADDKIVSRGHTNEPGKPHAEAMALQLLAPEIENFTMFVTLEPCSFQGRTSSCAKTIAKHKVKKVYVGMIDPHPKNQGTGIAILKAANIAIEVGVLLEEVKKDLENYLIVS